MKSTQKTQDIRDSAPDPVLPTAEEPRRWELTAVTSYLTDGDYRQQYVTFVWFWKEVRTSKVNAVLEKARDKILKLREKVDDKIDTGLNARWMADRLQDIVDDLDERLEVER